MTLRNASGFYWWVETGDGVEVQAWWLTSYATGAVDIIGVTFR